MTFWSGDKIAEDGKAAGLVEPFDAGRIDCSAYQLSLGEECFVTPGFGDHEQHVKTRLAEGKTVKVDGKVAKQMGGEMVIPPGQFAFLLTEEFVKIPKGAMGFISLRSKLKWKGLINVSGFHVDPGFHGRLVYSVFNAGPSKIHIQRGMPIFLLWIADLDRESSDHIKTDKPLTEISAEMISEVDRPLHSLQSLSEKIESIQRELTLLYRVLAALGVIAGLAVAIWALVPAASSPLQKPAAVDVL